jgi:hypothetical protein
MPLNSVAIAVGSASANTILSFSPPQTVPGGTKVQSVLDATAGTDLTINFDPFTPNANNILQLGGGLAGHILLIFF